MIYPLKIKHLYLCPSEATEESAPQVQEGPQSVFNEKELVDAISTYVKQRHVKTAIRTLLSAQIPKILGQEHTSDIAGQ